MGTLLCALDTCGDVSLTGTCASRGRARCRELSGLPGACKHRQESSRRVQHGALVFPAQGGLGGPWFPFCAQSEGRGDLLSPHPQG